jgi:purine-cytosine permease-like protein
MSNIVAGEPSSLEMHAVAEHERKGPVTMSLLWVTMVASFPSVLIGFEWHRQNLSFTQVLWSLFLSIGIILLYSIPICTVAARTGLSFKFLCRKFFNSTLTRNLTFCLIFLYLGWYAVTALFMADACCGLAGGKQYMPLLSFAFCFAMAFNNFFGFKGVANFARFVAAPVIICWIAYVFFRFVPAVPVCLKESHDLIPFSVALCTISQFTVGFAVWGNEADYWRNSNAKPVATGLALAAALIVGQVLFPLTGWIVAAQTGITDSLAATTYLNTFTFGKLSLLAILFMAASYFACNDSNLYAFAHAVESFTKMTHRKVVLILACLAGVLSIALTLTGTASALESMCALNSVLLPTATVLVIAEWFLFRQKATNDNSSLPAAHASATIAWCAGAALGIATSGLIPGLKALNVGIPALQAWIVALAIYVPMRRLELSAARKKSALQLEIENAFGSTELKNAKTLETNSTLTSGAREYLQRAIWAQFRDWRYQHVIDRT